MSITTPKTPGRDADADLPLPLRDDFRQPVASGRVVGSAVDGDLHCAQWVRRGVDVEGVLSVDGGALRIQPLVQPGWGRAGLAFGPVGSVPGRALVVHLLNGHHASQTHPPRSLLRQFARWLIGSGATTLPTRVQAFLRHTPRVRHLRRLEGWWRINRAASRTPVVDNLAVGWFPTEAPDDPRRGAHSLVIRATPGTNGMLTATVAGEMLAAVPEIHNVPLVLVCVLREHGALYLAGGLEGAVGLPAIPALRALAIDSGAVQRPGPSLYPGVHQAILGEIGFSVDTRVYEVLVTDVEELQRWCTTAVLADRLTGMGPVVGSGSENGEIWRGAAGMFDRTARGATVVTSHCSAQLVELPGGVGASAIGLVHVLVEAGAAPGEVGLAWRVTPTDHWRLRLSEHQVVVEQVALGEQVLRRFAGGRGRLSAGNTVAVQLIDSDDLIQVALDGRTVLTISGAGHSPKGAGIGLFCQESWGTAALRDLEAHPAVVHLPALAVGKRQVPRGDTPVVTDPLRGTGEDLAGHRSTSSDGSSVMWRRSVGSDRFLLQPEGLQVDAAVERPAAGRTLYTMAWHDPGLADLRVRITPPGTGRGQGHRCRAGLAFRQDSDNQLLVNTWLDDNFEGSSVSSFLTVNGFEDVFDAVWVNVGARIRWGRPYTLRVRFDGMTYVVSVDDDVVLYRRLDDIYPAVARFQLREVGLVTNWEWGVDTGSRFEGLVCAANRPPGHT